MRELEHFAALPYCYYNKYKKVISIKAISFDNEVTGISIIYGDPFQYTRQEITDVSGELKQVYNWNYKEDTLTKKMEGGYKTLWEIELPVPERRRLKYGFIVESKDGRRRYFSEYGYQDVLYEHINFAHNHFVFPFVHEVDAPHVSRWAKDIIWYQIFPERFFNGDDSISPENLCDWDNDLPEPRSFFGGDLIGIKKKLDYLKELGVTGIYLNPVFRAPSNHKYDTEDYLTVDEHFGDVAVLKDLVAAAHEAGIKVMLDAVFNHIGARHPFWRDVLKNQEKSEYKDYFHIKSFPVKESYEKPEDAPYDMFAFSAAMPKWNTENEKVREYLLDVAAYWIKECDIDGWRLDVADEVSLDFWREFGEKVREEKPDFYVVGEVWYDATRWIGPGYFDSVMNYPLTFAIEEMFLTGKISGREFTEKIFQVFTRYSDLHNTVAFNLLDSHDTRRALTAAGGNKQALKNAFAMLFVLPGCPSIYYGTEIGMDGGHDPDCRKPMVWKKEKQDLKLFAFFKELITFRKKYIGIISSGTIMYQQEGKIDIWVVAGKDESICLAYNAGETISYDTKDLVLATSEYEQDDFPSRTVRVYHKKNNK